MQQKPPYEICVMTGTRAEYGLLKPLLFALRAHPDFFHLHLIVSGTHLCAEYGYTYQEILQDGLEIEERLEILVASDTPAGTTKSVGLALISFADYFAGHRPDLVILLGDRFEAFACAAAAALAQIPIAHLYGGDTTEGLIDEFIRHSITKMSAIHFVSNEKSRQRVIQLGEHPARVFNVGALGVENVMHTPLLTREELAGELDFSLEASYAVATFHPVTLEADTAKSQVRELLDALREFPDLKVLFTKANADAGGRAVNAVLERAASENSNWKVLASLGTVRYLSALRYASFVIGNSSSGLYEAPGFHIPTVNIGDRQRGRMQAGSVVNCEAQAEAIAAAVRRALCTEFQKHCQTVINPFGDGTASKQIIRLLRQHMGTEALSLKKEFYDITPAPEQDAAGRLI